MRRAVHHARSWVLDGHRARRPEQETEGPGYSRCLVYHGGTDCAFRQRPFWTEPGMTYRVTGSALYDLDEDNDRYGRE